MTGMEEKARMIDWRLETARRFLLDVSGLIRTAADWAAANDGKSPEELLPPPGPFPDGVEFRDDFWIIGRHPGLPDVECLAALFRQGPDKKPVLDAAATVFSILEKAALVDKDAARLAGLSRMGGAEIARLSALADNALREIKAATALSGILSVSVEKKTLLGIDI